MSSYSFGSSLIFALGPFFETSPFTTAMLLNKKNKIPVLRTCSQTEILTNWT